MRIIAGEARGKKLAGPRDHSIRPALDRIRESLFSILGECFEERQVLDLFAGVGALGLEALSRGARRAVFVDREEGALAILRENIERLGFKARSRVIRGDALEKPDLEKESESYALVFMDPPFAAFVTAAATQPVLRRLESIVESRALEEDGCLCLRHPSRWRGDLPLEPTLTKKYGESTLRLFRSNRSKRTLHSTRNDISSPP